MERVQEIASHANSIDTIPIEFIRSETERPAVTTIHGVVLEVPVIDISVVGPQNIRLMVDACRDWGMFQIINHGIPSELITKLQKVGKEFFELPQKEKEKVAKTQDGIEGYGTRLQKEVDGKKGWVDHLFHKIWPPSAINYQFWPQNPPSYREVNIEYAEEMRGIADKLLESLSKGLGLKENELKDAVGGNELHHLLKINYYPPCPRPDLALGVVAHTDMSAITILVPNEVQGLQVYKDGNWYDVKYIHGALIVHIGDQMEILTNGKCKSVYHRTTVNKERTRMPWPVFIEPPPELEIGPIQKFVNEENPSKYKTKKYKNYVYCKLNKLPQ